MTKAVSFDNVTLEGAGNDLALQQIKARNLFLGAMERLHDELDWEFQSSVKGTEYAGIIGKGITVAEVAAYVTLEAGKIIGEARPGEYDTKYLNKYGILEYVSMELLEAKVVRYSRRRKAVLLPEFSLLDE